MKPRLLSEEEIVRKVKATHGWSRVGKEIKKTIALKNFVSAIGFINSVAKLAEKANHHPDIEIRWNKVTLTLSTHSAGGLTCNDFELAEAIDDL